MIENRGVAETEVAADERSRGELIADVRRGLARAPRSLPPKYFYDAIGSLLFEAICELPWYRVTRTESALLERAGAELASRLEPLSLLVELGCGSGKKLATVIERIPPSAGPLAIHLVDLSQTALDLSQQTLSGRARLTVVEHCCDYLAGLARAIAQRPAHGRALVLFLGSNIGNLDPDAAVELLRAIRSQLRPGDGLLLGTDLVKPEADLLLAYDDPIGVTAAFNRNLLARINRELTGDFDLAAFDHRAVWNERLSRVEMHLVSRRAQTVHIEAADLVITLAAGETIFTESSYKYSLARVDTMAGASGFAGHARWLDEAAGFAVNLLLAA
jgi:L-histidine N-alpha-methyltransferase